MKSLTQKSNRNMPKDLGKSDIEAAVLAAVSEALRGGVLGHDPRTGESFEVKEGNVKAKPNGRVCFYTLPINDDGEYFEISCKMRRM